MQLLAAIVAFSAVGLAVYQILPYLLRLFDGRLQNFPRYGQASGSKNTVFAGWLKAINDKNRQKMRQAGFQASQAHTIYQSVVLLLIITSLFTGLAWSIPLGSSLSLVLFALFIVNTWIARKIKTRQDAFKKALYKIYHFLDMQISSGIKVTDAIKGITESVQDRKVRPALLRFIAAYELTLDLDGAIDELRQEFPGPECDMLTAHLQQCLQTGQAGRSLRRMEELMFTRYFNLLQEDTRRLRALLFWLTLPALGSFIIIMVYPLLHTAAQAWASVFG